LQSQRLGRIATIDAAGELHVVPVGFRYNPQQDTIDIGGHNIVPAKKYRERKSNWWYQQHKLY
jgi:pyridoxamine 5'-phosphate oxidase family protein